MEQIRAIWQQGIKIGLIGGIAALLMALIGMLETFKARHVIFEIITMDQLFLLIVVLFFGYIAAKRTLPAKGPLVLANTFFVGLTIAFMLLLLIILGMDIWTYKLLDMRRMFRAASPELFKLLTFGIPGFGGRMLLLAAGGIVGLVSGIFYLLPNSVRKTSLFALSGIGVIGVLQDLVKPILDKWWPWLQELLFGPDGLSVKGAFYVFVLIGIFVLLWVLRGERIKTGWQHMPQPQQKTIKWSSLVVLALFLIVLPQIIGLFLSEALTIVGLYILLGLGLNIMLGYAGLFALGNVAFFAIGAYTVAVLCSPEIPILGFQEVMNVATGVPELIPITISFWFALPIAVIAGLLAGLLLGTPVLKMRGDYLAIATMGFGEIVRLLLLSDWLRPYMRGAQGISKIPKIEFFGKVLQGPMQIYFIIFAACL
ncbi:MAG: hypothetical protein EHM45_14040, partial [Desulfobacteraceae bacterium]